ncbi:MAG: hypothetical protein EF813_07155 [Methanosarcinales archaeon]|nr:MAG: hypothetical protein EF813_07155 [Methanosarcinales archaeon]
MADRPTPGPHRGNAKDRASKPFELSPIWVQLKSQSPDGKHPQQIFANTESHINMDRDRHHTHAPDRTQLRDGSSRRQPAGAQNSEIRENLVLLAAQESQDDMSDSGGGIRKHTRTVG